MNLPNHMTDRWQRRVDTPPGEGTVYWHMLMNDHPEVVGLAQLAQQRLAPFTGLHMTPIEWLHMTTIAAGSASRFSDEQLRDMAETAAGILADTPPVTIAFGRVLFHTEAIMLAARPAHALRPIYDAAVTATKGISDNSMLNANRLTWTPHVTVCYSSAKQPAKPLIDAVGLQLPECLIDVSSVSLVIQHGPERDWHWTNVATIRLSGRRMAVRPLA